MYCGYVDLCKPQNLVEHRLQDTAGKGTKGIYVLIVFY